MKKIISRFNAKNLVVNELRKTISVDLRSLALFRICLALVVIADLIARLPDLKAFYTGEGVLSLTENEKGKIIFSNYLSIHRLSNNLDFQIILFLLAIFFAIGMLLGYRTKFMILMTWLLNISLQNRNFLILSGADVLLRMSLFWALFVPLNRYFSLDSLNQGTKPKNNRIVEIGGLALILQVCFVYFFTVILKNGVEWRTEFTAVYYALNLEMFTTLLGETLFKYKNLMWFLTISTYIFEAIVAFLILFPIKNWLFRTTAIILLFFMHIGFFSSMHLGIFPFISIASTIALIPTEVWNISQQKLQNLRSIIYKKIITNRINLKIFLKIIYPEGRTYIRDHFYIFLVMSIICSFSLIIVFSWNLSTIDSGYALPKPAQKLATLLRLDQKWDMFAPFPSRQDGWYVVEAVKDNQQRQFIFNYDINQYTTFSKPDNISATYINSRWRKYLSNLTTNSFTYYRNGYAQYLCERFNLNKDINYIEIYFMEIMSLPDYKEAPATKHLLFTYNCPR